MKRDNKVDERPQCIIPEDVLVKIDHHNHQIDQPREVESNEIHQTLAIAEKISFCS